MVQCATTHYRYWYLVPIVTGTYPKIVKSTVPSRRTSTQCLPLILVRFLHTVQSLLNMDHSWIVLNLKKENNYKVAKFMTFLWSGIVTILISNMFLYLIKIFIWWVFAKIRYSSFLVRKFRGRREDNISVTEVYTVQYIVHTVQ